MPIPPKLKTYGWRFNPATIRRAEKLARAASQRISDWVRAAIDEKLARDTFTEDRPQ